MLQSPLTRKSVGSGCREDAKSELFKSKNRSSVDDSSYQISSASTVSSSSDKPQDRLNELNSHEDALLRSRDFPIKTSQIRGNYDRHIQNFGLPVGEVRASYVHNEGEKLGARIEHVINCYYPEHSMSDLLFFEFLQIPPAKPLKCIEPLHPVPSEKLPNL